MADEKQKIIKFEDYKQRIIDALNKRNLGIAEKVTIIDGFINQPIMMEFTGDFVVGGPALPMIMLVGNDSGRVYFFALKAIITDTGL